MHKEINNKNEIIKEILNHSKKITEALYRITDLFSDKEPLKWALRNESIQIFRLFALLHNTNDLSKKFSCFEKIPSKINRIVHILELASLNSFAANINFEVIKREYENINNIIMNNEFMPYPLEDIDGLKLNLSIGHNISSSLMSDSNKNLIGVNSGNDKITFEEKSAENKNEENNISVKENIHEDEDYKEEKGNKQNKDNFEIEIRGLSERAEKIINIIKEKEDKKAGINEIFDFFHGISKKTIQRELAKLVFMGYLHMDGIKRWRIYKLSSGATDKTLNSFTL